MNSEDSISIFLEEIPGPISKTTEELIKDIEGYDHNIYEEKYRAFQG